MGLELDQLHVRADLRSRGEVAGRLELCGGRGLVRGDDTGATETLVYLDPQRVGLFSDWSRLIRTLEPAGLLKVDPAGCQFLLAYGLVPPPYTPYANVLHLTVGDRLSFDLGRDEARLSVDFPYLESRSRGDLALDLGQLRDRLAGAVARAVPEGVPAVLMQSAGKDSTGLLVGLAAAGRTGVRAVTYDSRFRECEAPQARQLAARFGLPHVTVPADPRAEFDSLCDFAGTSPGLCADVALIAYLHVLRSLEVQGGVVIDGLGNDTYMGYVAPRSARWLGRLALARRIPQLWGRFEVPDLGAPASYLLKTLQMYPAERCLAGSRPSPRVALELVPHPTPFARFFADLDHGNRSRPAVDFRAVVRGRIFDGAGTLCKGRLAAAWRGARAVHPYCDAALIDYCFHLKRTERYDERRAVNKIALRRLLAREVGDASTYLRHKGSFRCDIQGFVAANAPLIRRELAGAGRLLPGIERWGEFYLRRASNYVHAYALVTLLIVAVWLARRPAAVVAPLAAGGCDLERANLDVVA